MVNAFLRMMSRHGARMWPGRTGAIPKDDPVLPASAASARAMGLPAGTDWAWRPDPWARAITLPDPAPRVSPAPLAPGTTLFHDGERAGLALQQEANAATATTAPYGLVIEVSDFDGSFVSLSLDLPAGATDGLLLRHIIRLDALIESSRPLGAFARLNIKHGREVEQLPQAFRPDGSASVIEFDLAPLRIDERQIERLWIDLILEQPAMNRVTLREVIASRLPRAEI